MTPDFPIGQGNLLPIIEDVLLDTKGRAIDLTGATVNFVMRGPAGCGQVVIDRAATIVDAKGGAVQYTWLAGDTDRAGSFIAVWRVTAGGKSMDVPNDSYLTVRIRPKVA